MSDNLDGRAVARVTITRIMHNGELVDHIAAVTAEGDELGIAEALGMIELGKDTLLRSRQAAGDGE